jgi:hypothetical protein
MLFSSHSQEALAAGDYAGPVLDAERLEVYKLDLDFQLLSGSLARRASATLRNQLERASVSIVFNIAEGRGPPLGRRQGPLLFHRARQRDRVCGHHGPAPSTGPVG